MDFELDRSQKQIQKAVWEFTRGEFDKNLILDMEKESLFPEQIWKQAAELGFLGLHFDEECSGGGMGVLENILVAEAFCRKDSTCGLALMLSGFASEIILRFGTGEQKKTFLGPVAEGNSLSGGAFFEPGMGYDLSTIEASAGQDGDDWVINGTKSHVVNGSNAEFYLVLCRTENHAPPGEAMAVILVEKDCPGVTVEESPAKLGNSMTSTASLFFENVRVPKDHLIGKNGRGLSQVEAFLNENRILAAGMALGIAQGALDRTLAYAKQREQFGRKIALFEILGHKMARMALKVKLARLITYEAAWAFDCGKITPAMAAMAMQYACQAAEEVADDAVQIHGGYGYMHEGEVEHFYRDAKYLRIHFSSQGSRNGVIADEVIGRVK